MKKLVIRGKAKGLIEVLSSHFIVLFITMLISFILPLRISVEEYGKWQLFTLISSYAGFFALGFNDGIHVKYSGLDYNDDFFVKFRSFRLFIEFLSIVSTVFAIGVVFLCNSLLEDKIFVYIIAAFNIFPALVNGFFAYVNQGTMRFGKYSIANIIERIIYIAIMFILIAMNVQNAVYYMISYSLTRYVVVVYNMIAAKELLGKPRVKLLTISSEIRDIFVSGFSLMIATIFNQSIIVPGRLIVENYYGIAAFSCYSFAIHTMVIANQITTAMSQVFFPAMKRANNQEFLPYFNNIDETLTLLSALLLLSYYPAFFLITIAYKKYLSMLSYLFLLYPLFIHSSKSLILIINTYKKDSNNKRLLMNNVLGVGLNILATVVAHLAFKTVFAVAAATLISYIIWYYICYIQLLNSKGLQITIKKFADLWLVIAFVLLNIIVGSFFANNYLPQLLISAGIYLLVLVIVFFIKREKCISILKTFFNYLNS